MSAKVTVETEKTDERKEKCKKKNKAKPKKTKKNTQISSLHSLYGKNPTLTGKKTCSVWDCGCKMYLQWGIT